MFWLPFEDQDPVPATLLAMWLCGLLFARIWLRTQKTRTSFLFTISAAGAGLFVNPFTVLLIIFKSGLHAHGSTDLPPEVLNQLLSQTALWGVVGLLLGLGFRLVELSRRG